MNAGSRRMTDAEVVSSVILRMQSNGDPMPYKSEYIGRLRSIEERLREEDESAPTIQELTFAKAEAMLHRSMELVQTDISASMIAYQARLVRDRRDGAAFLASLATLPNHEHRRLAHAIRTGELRPHQVA